MDFAQLLTPGRALMAASNLAYSIGAYIADWNETHVKNPRWPPHARFHNGQTMTMGALLASTSIYYLARKCPTPAAARDSLMTAAIIGSMYTLSSATGGWYPGALWIDPEFGEGKPQLPIFATIFILQWIGFYLELRRLG